MQGIKPVFYSIVAIALVISVCGCATQQVANNTIEATSAPSALPKASGASASHAGGASAHPSVTSLIAIGTSFPCVHETPDRTSVGVVTKVTDGDTIHVLINGTDYAVRYIGIDTPEDTTKKEWMGPEAAARNSQLVAGKTVTLVKDISETDRYGRLLRFVFVGDVFVNYELVREGYAQATPYPPDVSCEQLFYDAQLQAQQAHLGLWITGAAS
jgi:endonuclease YncB( thermonuclease family)